MTLRTTVALAAAALAAPAFAGNPVFETVSIDFDELAPAPSTFADAGNSVGLIFDNISLSGGVLLGTESFGAAQDQASQPNMYATIETNPTHDRAIVIDIDGGANSVSGLLFNGVSARITYVINAVDENGDQVARVTRSVAAFANGGFTEFQINSGNFDNDIHQVSFHPVQGRFFDYAIDALQISSTVPTPGAAAGLALAGLVAARRRR